MGGTYENMVESHLLEFQFRERYGGDNLNDFFENFIATIRQQFPLP